MMNSEGVGFELVTWRLLWLDALSEGCQIDRTRLDRGRTPAKMDRVGVIEIEPGLIRAQVDGSVPATASIGVSVLSEPQWSGLMDSSTEHAALSAALLAGELPVSLARHLLPGARDITCDCTCSDSAMPCVHAASLLHAVGHLFDSEPFALMLIRGRGRNDVMTQLRVLRANLLGVERPDGPDLPRGLDPGISAADAWRRQPSPLDGSPRVALSPGSLVTLAASPPADSGILELELRLLVEDAAARAHGVLIGDGDTALALSVGSDVVRRAASGDVAAISAATKVPLDELASAAQAWQFGGARGLRVSRHKWDPEPAVLQPALDALGPDARARANRVSLGRSQLRVDEDGHWWLFASDNELGWVLASESAADPNDLV